jgi:hypothetical protein
MLASPFASQAITNTAIAVSGTNIVLSWPSYGYESYLVQYRQTLDPTDSWSQVVNAYPANSTNRTTYTLYGLATPAIVGSGGGSNYGVPPLPSFASSSLASATITTASGASATISASTAAEAAATGSPLAIPADGSSVVPLALYPPHFDLAGFTILDPVTGTSLSGADYQAENPDFNTSDSGNTPQPMDGGGGSGGQSDPTTGFFRVFHIPDWLADFSGYTFDGPTFIPVDYESPDAPVDYVDSTTVLINGQPTDNAVLTPYVYNGVTNWGVGVYFDRFQNGTATIQLLTTVRQSDTLNDQTPYMVFSNAPATITIGNAITFTNWADLVLGNTYTFNAQSTVPNVDWEIDIYDAYNNFVNYQTGHSSDGNIAWTWDMTDYWGNSRMDDNDPFFYPEITITRTSMATGGAHPNAGGSTTTPMPVVAAQYPGTGSWLFSYLDKDYEDGTTNYPGGTSYMLNGIHEMEGAPIVWNIGTWEYPIKFGRSYSQADRDASWQGTTNSSGLVDWLKRWTVRNFYYYGHGSANSIGGDQNTVDTNDMVTGAINLPGGHAFLTSQWVHDNVTFNRWHGAMPYRFVWLDGCNTASGNWAWAWGVPSQIEPLSYYQSANNSTGARPSAFIGWNVEVGGKDWGTIQGFWSFRQFWMASWTSTYFQQLSDAFGDARDFSNWVPPAQVNAHLVQCGFNAMTFWQYNHGGDWP